MVDSTLLGICGSLRKSSYNRRLMHVAAELHGGDFIEADLRLPLYDGDLEDAEGIPPKVQNLRDQIAFADGIVICTPEYNKALPGLLKNALDWVSRTKGNPWLNKPVAIMSAAAGRAGGERSQFSLRLCLVAFRPIVVNGPEVLIGNAAKEFDEDGKLLNERYLRAIEDNMELLKSTAKL